MSILKNNDYNLDIDAILIQEAIELHGKDYLREWLSSDAAFVTAVRLSNHTVARMGIEFLISRKYSDTAMGMDVMNPDILADTYIAMAKAVESFDPTKGKWITYLYNTVPYWVLRAITNYAPEELVEESHYIEDDYEDHYNYEILNILAKEVKQTRGDRAYDIFQQVRAGRTYKAIGETLQLSESYVGSIHRETISSLQESIKITDFGR